MKTFRIFILSLLAVICMPRESIAQRDLYNWQITPYGGLLTIDNDIEEPTDANSYAYGLRIERRIGESLNVGLHLMQLQMGDVRQDNLSGSFLSLGYHWDNGCLQRKTAGISIFHRLEAGYVDRYRNIENIAVKSGDLTFGLENGLKFRFGDRITADVALEILSTEANLTNGDILDNLRFNVWKFGLSYHFGNRKSNYVAPVFVPDNGIMSMTKFDKIPTRNLTVIKDSVYNNALKGNIRDTLLTNPKSNEGKTKFTRADSLMIFMHFDSLYQKRGKSDSSKTSFAPDGMRKFNNNSMRDSTTLSDTLAMKEASLIEDSVEISKSLMQRDSSNMSSVDTLNMNNAITQSDSAAVRDSVNAKTEEIKEKTTEVADSLASESEQVADSVSPTESKQKSNTSSSKNITNQNSATDTLSSTVKENKLQNADLTYIDNSAQEEQEADTSSVIDKVKGRVNNIIANVSSDDEEKEKNEEETTQEKSDKEQTDRENDNNVAIVKSDGDDQNEDRKSSNGQSSEDESNDEETNLRDGKNFVAKSNSNEQDKKIENSDKDKTAEDVSSKGDNEQKDRNNVVVATSDDNPNNQSGESLDKKSSNEEKNQEVTNRESDNNVAQTDRDDKDRDSNKNESSAKVEKDSQKEGNSNSKNNVGIVVDESDDADENDNQKTEENESSLKEQGQNQKVSSSDEKNNSSNIDQTQNKNGNNNTDGSEKGRINKNENLNNSASVQSSIDKQNQLLEEQNKEIKRNRQEIERLREQKGGNDAGKLIAAGAAGTALGSSVNSGNSNEADTVFYESAAAQHTLDSLRAELAALKTEYGINDSTAVGDSTLVTNGDYTPNPPIGSYFVNDSLNSDSSESLISDNSSNQGGSDLINSERNSADSALSRLNPNGVYPVICNFESNQPSLKLSELQKLNVIVADLKSDDSKSVLLRGYADESGIADSNLQLYEQRANSLMEYLISKGIEKEKVNIETGESRNDIETSFDSIQITLIDG